MSNRLNCLECGDQFKTHKTNVKFCSRICGKRHGNRAARLRQKQRKSKSYTSYDEALHTEYNVVKKDVERRKRTISIKFQLTEDEFRSIVKGMCSYCGASPSVPTRVGVYYRNSIDRIDSGQDYVGSNCVSACWTCNKMKNTLSPAEFLSHVRQISEWNWRT